MVELDELQDAIKNLQTELQKSENKNLQLSTALTSYSGQQGNNLIEYQLDTQSMLERIEHFLRSDLLIIDDQGNEIWTKQKDPNKILFNDYGVNAIMSIIANYIDKNTILSYYDELRINEILADLGDELSNFIFCNYEKMGMDTEFKKTRFPLSVITILHSIESTYRRALRGKASEDLNTSKIFTQSDLLTNRPLQNPIKKSFNLLKPSTW